MDSRDFTTDSLRNKHIKVMKEGSSLVVHLPDGSHVRSTIYYGDWTQIERTLKKKLTEETMLGNDLVAIQEIIHCLSDNFAEIMGDDSTNSSSSSNAADTDAETSHNKKIPLSDDLTKEVGLDFIADILSVSIKQDYAAKVMTFLGMLNAQTVDDQFNIGFQAESSSGKSYIPLEISTYFPRKEVVEIAGATPASFHNDAGDWDNVRKVIVCDLKGKILIFMDMSDYRLLERLRPMLAHDREELLYKITDRNERKGLRTKTVVLRGFPSVFFSSVKATMDDQEKTRLIVVSPEIDQQKILEALELSTLRKSNPEEYDRRIMQDPKRKWLIQRVLAIRQSGVKNVILLNNGTAVFDKFVQAHPWLLSRHMRDLPRIISFVKSIALFNCFHREKNETPDCIIAKDSDIDQAFRLYSQIEESNEIGLSPYHYQIYKDVFEPLIYPVNGGVSKEDILRKFYQVRHKSLSPESLRLDIMPQLEAVGLVIQLPDEHDRRRLLVHAPDNGQNNSGTVCGVKSSVEQTSSTNENEKSYPTHPYTISPLFWEVYEGREKQNESDGKVGEHGLKLELVCTGKFTNDEAIKAINDAVASGELERPEWGRLCRSKQRKKEEQS